jgi:glutamate decarboxylase
MIWPWRRCSASQIVHDELMLDGNARLNVATFVTTWMEPQAPVHDRTNGSGFHH